MTTKRWPVSALRIAAFPIGPTYTVGEVCTAACVADAREDLQTWPGGTAHGGTLRTRRHDGAPRVSTGHRLGMSCRTSQAAAVVRCGSSTERLFMRFRLRALIVPSFLLAAACSDDSPSTTPDGPGSPGAPGEGQTVPPIEQRA